MSSAKHNPNHFKDFLIISGVALAFLLALLLISKGIHNDEIGQSRAAESFTTFAVLGDSNSDEYRADDNRGGAYASTTLGWIELLTKYKGMNFGTYSNWGGFRRSGFQYNFSRSGATTVSAFQSDAPAALGALVSAGTVRSVFYQVGANDFAWYNSQFSAIYNGTLAGSSLSTYNQSVANNVAKTLDIINASGKAKILVSLIPDATKSPSARANFPDPVKLKRVSDAVLEANTAIRSVANTHGYAIFDADSIGTRLLSNVDPQGNYLVAGEKISFATPGDEPHHILLGDAIHAGTVFSGIYANEWMNAMNTAFGTQFIVFTDSELLTHAGIQTSRATPLPSIVPSPVMTPAVSASPTMRPTTTPWATIMPTRIPTSRPQTSAVPTPRPTAIPVPVDPLVKYCGQYKAYRFLALRFMTPAQINVWDTRCVRR